MSTIIVSGHARKAGKTSVVTGLIHTFSEYQWIALKVSTHWHSKSSSVEDLVIHEEKNSGQESDSSRFLAAGARRSFWVQMQERGMESALPQLKQILQSGPFVIIEGNNIHKHVSADIHIMVVNCNVAEIKESARCLFHHLDILLIINSRSSLPSWKDVLLNPPNGCSIFETEDSQILPPAFLDLIRFRMLSPPR
jgi:hypothetical protein